MNKYTLIHEKIKSKIKMRSIKRNHAQMITLMGIVLAISVFVVSSITSEIENIEFIISTEEYSSLKNEFEMIKDSFAETLNYNLVDVKIDPDTDECEMEGNIANIYEALDQTVEDYSNVEFRYGRIFDAKLNRYWHTNKEDGVYYVSVTLRLEDSGAIISEDVVFYIVCN